jgi:hypothetical protein
MPRRAESPPRQRRAERGPDLAFALELQVRPSLSWPEGRQLERRLQDYAEAQGLQIEGTQLRHRVSATDRPVSVNDQVALIDWLVDQPGLVGVRVGTIGPRGTEGDDVPLDEEGAPQAFVQLRTCDLVVIGLTLLYRCGRITPALYLQILGGYVRPVHLH